MRTSDFDYELPTEFIAQRPVKPRDYSRLMLLDRRTGEIEHRRFFELPAVLRAGDTLVLNETHVLPARIFAHKQPGGGRVELLLLNRNDARTWQVMVGGKGLSTGRGMVLENGLEAFVLEELGGPKRLVQFEEPVDDILPDIGEMPLPPYITTPLKDPDEYQTIFSRKPGSSAAPTAGLHFTQELFDRLSSREISIANITLHIGLDTFAPVRGENPRQHPIHTEWCSLSSDTADMLNKTKALGGRVIAVGTTAVRTLETAYQQSDQGEVRAYEGATDLYILPGYTFKIVDAMITNFHLPRSTLLMLVSAFASRKSILNAYEQAKQAAYRFYSFGDAMLIS